MARALPFLLAALCLAAPSVRADEPPRPAPPRAEQQKPLSAEDAEVVKQLALLEQVELLRNLDLFVPDPAEGQPPKDAPDAGTP
jgi:hypothetical protein